MKLPAAVDHPMPNRRQADGLQVDTGIGQLVERAKQRRVVVGDR